MKNGRRPGPAEATLGPRIAALVRTTRTQLGWTQGELGGRAGVSRTQVWRIERGLSGHGRVDEVARLLDAVEARVDLQVRPPVLIGAPAQRDAAHARVVAYTTRHLGRTGITIAREVPIGADRVRGWIDILGTDASRDADFVVECKGDLDDVGSLERQVSWYEREAPLAARRLGWPHRRHRLVLVTMLATRHNVELVRANRELLRERFPLPVAALRSLLGDKGAPPGDKGAPPGDEAAPPRPLRVPTRPLRVPTRPLRVPTGPLRVPPGPLRALAFVDPARRGPGWLIATPLGPGRPVVPYDDARSFLEGRRRV